MKSPDSAIQEILRSLLPCPFCGSDASLGMDDPGAPFPGGYFFVECRNEACFVDTDNFQKGRFEEEADILKKLAGRWNARHNQPLVDALKEIAWGELDDGKSFQDALSALNQAQKVAREALSKIGINESI